MNTLVVETLSNVGELAGPDLNLQVLLRKKVIPVFLADVGHVAWRRKTVTLSMSVGTKEYDLPTDFWDMEQVNISPNFDKEKQLIYIGEEPEKVMAAQASTDQAKPQGYYFGPSATVAHRRIFFDAPPDQAYTVAYTYYSGINFTDDTTLVDLDPYIPPAYQWTLVEGLKREMYGNRFGLKDNRFALADSEYKLGVQRASESKELANRRKAVHVR